MVNAFFNKNEEVRSGWKVAVLLFGISILKFVLVSILEQVFKFRKMFMGADGLKFMHIKFDLFLSENTIGIFLKETIELSSVIIMLLIIFKLIDCKKLQHIELIEFKKNIIFLMKGLGLGALCTSIVFFILIITKNISISSSVLNPKLTLDTFLGFAIFTLIAIKQEVIFRGYCISSFNAIEKKPWASITISSSVFVVVNILTSNFNFISIINLFLLGVLLGFIYNKTKNLWMCIGYNLAWHYFQGSILGLSTSGINCNGVYDFSNTSDNIFNGGGLGPQGGIVVTIAIILIGALLVKVLCEKTHMLSI